MRAGKLIPVVLVLCVVLVLNLYYLQIVRGAYYRHRSFTNRIKLVVAHATRGRIFDRNGKVLADSRPSYNVGIVKDEWDSDRQIRKEQKKNALAVLSRILETGERGLSDILDEKGLPDRLKTPPFAPKIVAADIPRNKAIALEEAAMDLPGVMIQVTPVRGYPYGEYAANITGYLGKINEDEFSILKPYGYRHDDMVGRTGVEEYNDEILHGEHGGKQIQVDATGRSREELLKEIPVEEELYNKEPVKGDDITLSIDIRLQKLLGDLIGESKGAGVVMSPYTGEVLAMVTRPSFDPNVMISSDMQALRRKVLSDPRHPLINRATQSALPPGSAFKVIIAAAALESGRLSTHTTFSCSGEFMFGGRSFRCWNQNGHGGVALTDAIAQSCNVFFYRTGLLAGIDDIATMAQAFGMGEKTGVDLPGEHQGFLPTRKWKKSHEGEQWYEGDTVNLSIGQGYVQVTPLQLAAAACAIANDGYLPTPRLLKGAKKKFRKVDVPAGHLRAIREGMEGCVSYGTARAAAIPGLPMSGKTGTAQAPPGDSHAWFIGFAPSKDPKIAFCILLERGIRGGAAAVVASDMVKAYLGERQ